MPGRLCENVAAGTRLFVALLDLMKGRAHSRRRQSIEMFVMSCFTNIGILWHCRVGEKFWNSVCPLSTGVLSSGQKRPRRVPAMFKQALVDNASECRGKGVRTAGQLLVGIQVGQRHSVGHHRLSESKNGQDAEYWYAYNYWLSMRYRFFVVYQS